MFINFIIKYYVILNFFLVKKENISHGKNLRIRGSINLDIDSSGSLKIGDSFSLTSGLMLNPLGRNLKSSMRIDSNAKIVIGNNVGMSCVCLWAKKSIQIGNNVKLGSGVIIIDSDMHSLNFVERRDAKTDSINAKSKEISIKDDAFIGVNSIITKGITIGERSIVAAGSVVTKSIPSDEIWGGNPAVFIKKIDY